MQKNRRKLIPEKSNIEKKNDNLRVGDLVKVINTSTKGEIMEINKGTAIINSNGLTVKSPLSKLELISVNTANKQSDYKIILQDAFDTRLDIRGKYVNEIEDLLDKFIYEGHINSVSELTIVHGKGTGSLRKAVQSILKSNKLVNNFRLGNWNEGDTGVTVIELKK